MIDKQTGKGVCMVVCVCGGGYHKFNYCCHRYIYVVL